MQIAGTVHDELIGGSADRECAAVMREMARTALCRVPEYAA